MNRTSSAPLPSASATADLTNLVGVKLGNYRLERLIGRGRMGVVYLANDVALLRPTAVKVLSWSAAEAQGQDPVQWFLAEARLVARINHPRVVQIYGAARHGAYCYIAMEYVAGHSAEAAVAEGGSMAPERATDVLLQAASALHAAHRSGVVHRDVKPANLLIGTDGVTKLGDFGMALGAAGAHVGQARVRVGTPYYTAPEVWRGEPASAASDIYSLGATYFQLLTGRPPFPGADVAAVEQAHLRAPVPDPRELAPGLPASCAALIQRALAKSPRERHASAQVLSWDGRQVLQELTAAAEACARPRPRPPPSPPARPPLSPAEGPLADVLGFVHRPFFTADPADGPYEGASFAGAWTEILEAVEDEGLGVLALTCADGRGLTALCRRVAAELGRSRLVLLVDVAQHAEVRTLLQRLCRAAGVAEEASQEGSLDALVERLAEERRKQRSTPLVMLDGLTAPHPTTALLASLVGAGSWTRAFQTLLCGEPRLLERLADDGIDFRAQRVREIEVKPLAREQVPAYVRSWVEAALAPHAPPIIFSADALRLMALRSEGALERLDCIAENMLLLAADDGRRTLTSWHAWTASDRERWSVEPPPAGLPRRPAHWPPPDVIAVLDACRRGAGVPPWPRGGRAADPADAGVRAQQVPPVLSRRGDA
jgi:type II secretory pathway predicted ATPase ExeA